MKGRTTAVRKPKAEETTTKKPASTKKTDKKGDTVNQLQQQVGNRAVQRLLSHTGLHSSMLGVKAPPANEEEQTTSKKPKKALVEAGTVKVEKPRIEYYDVSGSNLAQVKQRLLRDGKWYEHNYRYAIKSENGIITRVDIIVEIKVHLPRWVGPGWAQAPRTDKLAWMQMLSHETPPNERHEELTRMPTGWVGMDWPKAPDSLKADWRGRLQRQQQDERAYLDVIMRRVLILQQRMLGNPAKQVKAIFDKFNKDLKIETEAYNRQLRFGQPQKVSIGAGAMLQ